MTARAGREQQEPFKFPDVAICPTLNEGCQGNSDCVGLAPSLYELDVSVCARSTLHFATHVCEKHCLATSFGLQKETVVLGADRLEVSAPAGEDDKTSIRSRHGPVLLRYIRTACINKRYCILPLNVLFLRVRAKKINDPDSLLQ